MNSLRKAFYHLKMSQQYFEDVVRQVPGTVGAKLSKEYARKISFIENNFRSSPLLPSDLIQGFREEMGSDIMFHESISEKLLRLSPKQKESFENIVDELLNGQSITVEIKN